MVFYRPRKIVSEVKKRYYIFTFICLDCSSRYRLRDLIDDFMGYFHCPDCNTLNFRIKKDRVSEIALKKKPDTAVVLIENIKIKGSGSE